LLITYPNLLTNSAQNNPWIPNTFVRYNLSISRKVRFHSAVIGFCNNLYAMRNAPSAMYFCKISWSPESQIPCTGFVILWIKLSRLSYTGHCSIPNTIYFFHRNIICTFAPRF
jgi:hypothetical protein